jgi:2-keto-4-pentenoate hydratase/2-oxohepta-3-ene-1,7-dioic acid hydratase in catechol pathway
MRFTTFEIDGATGLAVSRGGALRGLLETDPGYPGDLDTLIARGADLAEVGQRLGQGPEIDASKIRWLPPLRRPGKILCVGLNYIAHAEEFARQKTVKYPEIFARFANTLVGHLQPIVKPAVSDMVDYEGELAVIIGRGGRNVPKELALRLVAGYSLFNDVSIRDFQKRVTQWIMGKNFDGTGPFGPWLATADELPPGAAGLGISTRLNGQVMQKATTDDLIFDVAALIEYVSQAMTLSPGDLIVSGTPGGVGVARDPQVFMRDGDLCEIEIEGLGLLANKVAAEKKS